MSGVEKLRLKCYYYVIYIRFSECGKKYAYLCEGIFPNIGDYVLVEGQHKYYKVVDAVYVKGEDLPYPLDQMKKVMRFDKCGPDDDIIEELIKDYNDKLTPEECYKRDVYELCVKEAIDRNSRSLDAVPQTIGIIWFFCIVGFFIFAGFKNNVLTIISAVIFLTLAIILSIRTAKKPRKKYTAEDILEELRQKGAIKW